MRPCLHLHLDLGASLRALLLLAAACGPVWVGVETSRADETVDPALEEARAAKIKELRRDLRKWAQGPYAAQHRDDLLKVLEALHSLGGLPAALAAVESLFAVDAEVRDRAFQLIELVHDKALIEPLAGLIEHKDLRRDFDLQRRIAHALAVTGDVAAIEPLTTLVQSPDGLVVAAAADGLATFGEAKVDEKREAVQRLVDLYEGTWNMMNSVRPEDRVPAKVAAEKWEIFGRSVRQALQALTKQQLSLPKDWRRWWNDHKKDAVWKPGEAPVDTGGR
jgi:hypothetical protein